MKIYIVLLISSPPKIIYLRTCCRDLDKADKDGQRGFGAMYVTGDRVSRNFRAATLCRTKFKEAPYSNISVRGSASSMQQAAKNLRVMSATQTGLMRRLHSHKPPAGSERERE